MPRRVAALAGALGFLLGGCSPSTPPADPPRPARPAIVSLNPCSDAVLAEVAGPGQLKAISHYSHDPRSSSMDLALARRFAATGGTVEEVLALKPDLVVSGTFVDPATLHAFARAGVRVELVPIAVSVAESEAQIRRLATLAGNPAGGEELVARIESALAAARPPHGASPVPALIWQSGGIVPGRDTLIAELLNRTGFVSYSAQIGMKQADYLPLEVLVADPPPVVFIAGEGHGEDDRMLLHPALGGLSGTRRESFEPSLLYCGGPTIERAAARLAEVRRSIGRLR